MPDRKDMSRKPMYASGMPLVCAARQGERDREKNRERQNRFCLLSDGDHRLLMSRRWCYFLKFFLSHCVYIYINSTSAPARITFLPDISTGENYRLPSISFETIATQIV